MRSEPTFERVRRRVLAIAFFDELGPLLALYTLFFDNQGITVAQISFVFALWVVVGLGLEIPTGALADRLDRRHVVAWGLALRGLGVAVWLLAPSYEGVLVGALLWAGHDALVSGAWEAMIYDELEARGHADRYPSVMARALQATHLGTALSAGLAAALGVLGVSLEALGWLTVAFHGVSASLVLSLPPAPRAEAVDAGTFRAFLGTLRSGVAAAARNAVLARLVLLLALVEGLFLFDEYVPLLARAGGAGDPVIPGFVVLVWGALLLGGELAARRPDLASRVLGGLLTLGGLVLAGGLVTGGLFGVLGVAAAYFALQTTWVLAEARAQAEVSSAVRATVGSVRSFFGSLVGGVFFLFVGAVSGSGSPAPALAVAALAVSGAGILVARWLPEARGPLDPAGGPSVP